MCQLAPEVIREFERLGAPFSRFDHGLVAQRPFGGGGFPRTCYAADRTGHVLLHTLYEQLVGAPGAPACGSRVGGVTVYDERAVTRIAVDDGRCHGLIAYNLKQGRFESFAARFCVFATGGYGRVYRNSTNALINTGSGIGMALAAGIGVKDLEFVQFHPTSLFGTNILITEGARGEGGYLVNRGGERFMARYVPKTMELAPRDIVARTIQTEINEGRGCDGGYIHLDLRHLGKARICSGCPASARFCLDFAGIDPIEEPIPIQPCQHYSMGGIDTDVRGRTTIDNFYAAGECACVSVHGANRLGGNSLLDTLVFGRLVAEDIAARLGDLGFKPRESVLERHLAAQNARLDAMLSRGRAVPQTELRESLRAVMTEQVGIFRCESDLADAVAKVRRLRQQYAEIGCCTPPGPFNYEILQVLELEGLLCVAEVIAEGALRGGRVAGRTFAPTIRPATTPSGSGTRSPGWTGTRLVFPIRMWTSVIMHRKPERTNDLPSPSGRGAGGEGGSQSREASIHETLRDNAASPHPDPLRAPCAAWSGEGDRVFRFDVFRYDATSSAPPRSKPTNWKSTARLRCWKDCCESGTSRTPRWPFVIVAAGPSAARAACRSTAGSTWPAACSFICSLRDASSLSPCRDSTSSKTWSSTWTLSGKSTSRSSHGCTPNLPAKAV